jgi:predicted amidohydrolase YtcJ
LQHYRHSAFKFDGCHSTSHVGGLYRPLYREFIFPCVYFILCLSAVGGARFSFLANAPIIAHSPFSFQKIRPMHATTPIISCLVSTAFLVTVGSAQTPSTTADLAILHAVVHVCDGQSSPLSAVAVRDGQIVAVGDDETIQPWIGPDTRVVDGTGKTVTPGFTDSHLHFIGLGQSLQMLDLSRADSWPAIVEQVAEAARLVPKGTWIEGRGWHQSKWQIPLDQAVDGYPLHDALSEAVPDHPVLLTHASGHASIANAHAMRLAQVDSQTSDPPGGELLRDRTGNPIGVFRENAQALVRRAAARGMQGRSTEQRLSELQEQIRLAGEACLQHGITSAHDASSTFSTARDLKILAERGELPVRLSVMIRENSESLAAHMTDHRWPEIANGFLSVRSVKVSVDGALGSHGAWLLRPYSDLPHTSGLNTVALDELERIAILCRDQDWQLCVHAIGDRANREVLDIYEKTLGERVAEDHRWRIEHAQHLAPQDIPRFGKLGVIPAMQTNHCTSDAPFVPMRLGERRSATGAYVWRSLIDTGSIVPNGTDAPVEKVDPRASLYAAVTRQLANGETFYPEQCMTREEALLSYTLWPAQASFQEASLGSITVGKRADLVVWDTDLISCEPQQILQAKVLMTIQDGQPVFTRDSPN